MPVDSRIDRFGPFALDRDRRRLSRDGRPLDVGTRQLDVLLALTANAGHVVPKATLFASAWPDVAVTDDSLVQAVGELRRLLGRQPDAAHYIETCHRKGYRFTAIVEYGAHPVSNRAPADGTVDDVHAILEPYRAFVEGRTALETLDRHEVARARDAFTRAIGIDPSLSAGHIGLATALLLQFESTRADAEPDRDALAQADHHARLGCRLSPASADAWSTLALARHRYNDAHEAMAAARKAVSLEPGEWRHHLRLGFVAGGGERLRAAQRVLALCPGLALAHWLAATVFVARQAFDAALEHLRAGCAAQDAQQRRAGRFDAVGLHLLHGLVIAAQEDLEGARAEFARELAFEDSQHVYARETAANAWYALGALSLRSGRRQEAGHEFEEALRCLPRHALAMLGVSVAGGNVAGAGLPAALPGDMGHAIAQAALFSLRGQHADAARVCGDAFAHDAVGPGDGWVLTVEPLLDVAAHREAWAQTLALLHQRHS